VERPKRRDRYIAFEVEDPRRARGVASALQTAVAPWPREARPSIVFIQGVRGLVRCGHREKDAVIEILNSLEVGDPPVRVRTVGTSGTIRAARSRYFSKS